MVKDRGANIQKSVNKKTDLVVVGENPGKSKLGHDVTYVYET